ncbi:putative nucleic acid-binding protein [Halopolyspora algeriensis]|uniref:Ribonuclease VapC n=1 Tax=Halopolyspora algeriensis TaxID=1500506 RepID=A0A368VUK1_9ACTN|nr:type II toxin-antitoxin system VapC family toxin [Halopolyspora algeriensis]RCW43646.1 putative nucleic acid-binding protein [Halopolyspora algeriensis]TQM47571.1 putative nucleic acid-binding protein [Halopolyspora algeriensis]
MSVAVVDASVWCDALLPGPRRTAARSALDSYTAMAAPEHLQLEITQVLRRHARHDLGAVRAEAILRTLREMPVEHVPTRTLLDRIWELREALTAYDAAYVAVAEQRDAPLITRDKGLLAHAGTVRCAVLAVPPEQGASAQ